MAMMIKSIKTCQIFDNHGNPTVEIVGEMESTRFSWKLADYPKLPKGETVAVVGFDGWGKANSNNYNCIHIAGALTMDSLKNIVAEVNMLRGVPDEIKKLQRNVRRLSKFLTWFSLRSTEQECWVVVTFIRTLIEEPSNLAGQLLDSFTEIVARKRSRNGFCSKL